MFQSHEKYIRNYCLKSKVLLNELFQNVTCIFIDDLTELADTSGTGDYDEAVGLQDGHPIMHFAHDDDLTICSGDVRTRTGPVHILQCHFQRLLPKELQPHFLIFQDLLHGDQSETGVLVLRQLRHASQNDKIAFTEAGHHFVPRLARLALVGLWKWTGVLARFFGLEVVLVAFTTAVNERLALSLEAAVGPSRFVCFARPLIAGKVTRDCKFFAA